MGKYLKKFFVFLEKLSSKPKIGGLEISDSSIKYVYFNELEQKAVAIKLPPGIIKDGKIVDEKGLAVSFDSFFKKISNDGKSKEPLKVNVILPSNLIFTQVLDVPTIGQNNLEEAVSLNLRMISPLPEGEANMDAEIIFNDDFNYELFAAFISKEVVLAYQRILSDAGFIPLSFEFKSLALARFLRNYFKIPSDFVLILDVDVSGIEISVLKNKRTAVNYFKSWSSLGSNIKISQEIFEKTIVEEMRRILNFVSSKFGFNISSILFLAPGLESLVSNIIYSAFNIKPTLISSSEIKLTPSFYSTLGAALRFFEKAEEDKLRAINLGGKEVIEYLYRERIINFVSFWRKVLTVVLIFIFSMYVGGYLFVVGGYSTIEERIKNFNPPVDNAKLESLRKSAQEFNSTIAEINNLRVNLKDFGKLLSNFFDAINKSGVKVKLVNNSSLSSEVNMIGNLPSYDAVFKFKDLLERSGFFSDIVLPVTKIISQPDGSVDFNISFKFKY